MFAWKVSTVGCQRSVWKYCHQTPRPLSAFFSCPYEHEERPVCPCKIRNYALSVGILHCEWLFSPPAYLLLLLLVEYGLAMFAWKVSTVGCQRPAWKHCHQKPRPLSAFFSSMRWYIGSRRGGFPQGDPTSATNGSRPILHSASL